MAYFNWKDSFSVKIPSIDEQHKKLISMINKFYEDFSAESSNEKLLDLIKGMKDYTIYHFSKEENLMKEHGYGDYETHKNEHAEFVIRVEDFFNRFRDGKILVTVEVTNFLKDWVSDHIMGTDMKYSDFFIGKGVR